MYMYDVLTYCHAIHRGGSEGPNYSAKYVAETSAVCQSFCVLVCLCLCMCLCVHMYVCVCVYIYIYVYACLCVYVYVCV